MIYEKRTAKLQRMPFDTASSAASILVKENCITQYDREDLPPAVTEFKNDKHGAKRIRCKKKQRVKNHVLSKFLLMSFTLFFCITTLDGKFNEGKYTQVALEYLQNVIEAQGKYNFAENIASQENINKTMGKMNFPDDIETTPLLKKDSNSEQKKVETDRELQSVPVTSSLNAAIESDGEVFYPITKADLSAQAVTVMNNETVYEPDMEKLSNTFPKALENFSVNSDEPLVLIVHTHAGECYTKHLDMYPEDENTRSENTDENVVRVGREIAETLENYGINTLHCTKLCDRESFIDAYNVSHDTVKEYLEKYPSIRLVIDVHRDAIIKQSGESIKPVVNIAGQEYAQLMFVVGTDQSAHSHPDWEDNLSLALCIQKESEKRYPGLFRPINLRTVPFNQWLSNGYLLLETGASANTLEEALLSAQAFGHILSVVLNQNSIN